MDIATSIQFVEHLSYLGVFLAMATTGYLVPLPEEIILLVGGFLIASGVADPSVMVLVSFLGAITGDTFIYYICHHGGRFAHKLRSRVEEGTFSKYICWFKKNKREAIFVTRFILGMRFLSPVISGLLNIPWHIFIIYNSLAALIFVPLIISFGYFFHTHIHDLVAFASSIRHAAFLLLLVIIVGFCSSLFIRAMWRRR